MVRAATSPTPPPASCVFLPGVDRKQLANNALQLERAAADAHKAAQQLNKEGRYEVRRTCLCLCTLAPTWGVACLLPLLMLCPRPLSSC